MSDYVPLNNQGNGNEDGNPSILGSSPTTPSINHTNIYEYRIEKGVVFAEIDDIQEVLAELDDKQEVYAQYEDTGKKAVLDCNKSTADSPEVEDSLDFLRKEDDSSDGSQKSKIDLKIDADQNPYVTDKNIFTLKNVGVKFCISGVSAGHSIQITMKNLENAKKDNPVKPCLNHENESIFPLDEELKGSMCYVNCNMEPKLTGDKHPSLLIHIKSEMIKDGCMKFPIFIKCNNSCSSKFGRKWNLTLSILLCDVILMEETFIVKVAAYPNRDKKQATENEKKRKAEIQEGPADHSKKTKKIMTVEMPTQKHQDMIKEIAERFGGKVHSIDVCSSFPVL